MLIGFRLFFALDAADDNAAIVAQQLCAIAAGEPEQRLGAEILQVAFGN